MSIEARARRIIEEFAGLTDPLDRYRHLVALGDGLPGLPDDERTETNQLPGCQFAVWIRSTYDPATDRMHFGADSDARITRGLAALILQLVDGLSPLEILAAELDFLDEIGLREQLSVHRGNGLAAFVEEIRARARRHADDAGAAA